MKVLESGGMSKAGCDIRIHGTAGRYGGDYADKMLADWAGWIKLAEQRGRHGHLRLLQQRRRRPRHKQR